ncbi:hypothetical protein OG302_41745 [Streptomyces sp. NBC_01283]|uniref:DUF3592 domain-containing protein n=1 Tax=Streptomyces sp. NBC_01283 TaxID=2903812 RepID=UPI00352C857A|nr:hypothetical protein OG302_41745 [Streptomyces sp. NBC_01283]
MFSGAVIPIAVIAIFVLYFSAGIYKRDRALWSRGIRVSAACVNEARENNGSVSLLVQFEETSGTAVQVSVGPFRYPPAGRGEELEIVYDPRDPANSATPDRMSSGRTALAFAIGSTVVVTVCLVLLLFAYAF